METGGKLIVILSDNDKKPNIWVNACRILILGYIKLMNNYDNLILIIIIAAIITMDFVILKRLWGYDVNKTQCTIIF